MRKGFIFNQNRCVACGACDAACILENGWNFHARTVFKFNQEAISDFPVMYLSMACNHCEIPSCLNSCPANAYSRDLITGAILINDKRCIGCNYCTWNCPYDAPKSDRISRMIGKCNLCQSLLIDGGNPACTSACPTGALKFDIINEKTDNKWVPYFPEKNLNPSIFIPEEKSSVPLKIVPSEIFDTDFIHKSDKEENIKPAWSLIAFSFLATLSVSFTGILLLSGNLKWPWLPLLMIMTAGFFSVFHLGKKFRAWSAVSNILKSPLSKEIVMYLIYLSLSAIAFVSGKTGFLLASALSGAVMLVIVDSVYAIPDYRSFWYFHSGQTFISGLLILSYFAEFKTAFIFIAMIKLTSGVFKLFNSQYKQSQYGIRFLRLALLIIAGISFITGISYHDPVVSFLFITGELSDRILFYFDFEPLNINTLISQQLKIIKNEKKRN
jgi:Fe-S-cluster-containing dehydrogenase component